MNCPRCNTELPDSATFCVRCGTPVQSARFSYLPAGAPSWPTSTPQNLSFVQETNVVESLPTDGSPSVPQKRAGAAKKSSLSIPVIIGLFLLSILIGAGVTFGILSANGQLAFGSQPTTPPVHLPTPGASATPGASSTAQGDQLPTPTSFQTISSSDLGISLKYPSDWQKVGPSPTQNNDIEVRLSPSQQLGMVIFITRYSQSDSANFTSTTSANQSNLAAFSQVQGVTNLQPTTSSQPTIGGVRWDEQNATFTGPNNIQYDFVTIAVQHNKTYFVMTFYSPDTYYKEAIRKYFQPMFDSFKFLS
jgi:zinc-ribbon domain